MFQSFGRGDECCFRRKFPRRGREEDKTEIIGARNVCEISDIIPRKGERRKIDRKGEEIE